MAPFLSLTVLTAALVGFLSFRNGQAAVNDVAHQLRGEIVRRIEDHLKAFLGMPHLINAWNAEAMGSGLLDPRDPAELERHFWQQARSFPSVSSISFGNTDGGVVNSGREGTADSQYVIATDGFKSGPLTKFATDRSGNRTVTTLTVPHFDARTRPWYVGAVEKGNAAWSPVYILSTGQEMAVAASRPVYDARHDLLGVVSADLFLSHLGSFLATIAIPGGGQAFIFERSGLLVASSSEEKPFLRSEAGAPARRLGAAQSGSHAIRRAAEAMKERFGDYDTVSGRQDLVFQIDDQRHFMLLSPVDEPGIDWLIAVVIPEAEFLARIKSQNRTTILLIVAALILAVIAGIVAAGAIIRPVKRLNASAQALTAGRWSLPAPEDFRIAEISDLTDSFNRMAGQLKSIVGSLSSELAEHKRTEDTLRESQQRLDLVLEGAELASWDWDVPSGRIAYNKRWSTMLGYPLEEIEPHVRSWEKLVNPADLPRVMEALQTHLEGRTPLYEVEYRLRGKSGGWIWVLDKGRVLRRDGHGKPMRAVGIHIDITERKEMERRLLESQKRESLDTMAGAIAHHFNNLLMAVLGNLELIRDGLPPEDNVQDMLREAQKAAQRAAELSALMLTYVGQEIGNRVRCDLSAEITAALPLIQTVLPPSVELIAKLAPALPLVQIDTDRFRQITVGLASNAGEAIGAKKGRVRISTGSAVFEMEQLKNACGGDPVSAGHYLYLEVSDNGCGMDEETAARMFDPFFTTKFTGRGLSLAMALGVVRSHGGCILVDSHPGSGTTIRVLLPAAAPLSPKAPVERPSVAPAVRTVLLAEDEEMVSEITVGMLKLLGFAVIAARDGEETVALFKKHTEEISCLLCDLSMPGRNGWEVLAAVRQVRPEVPFVLTSGHDKSGIASGHQADPFWTFLRKPYSLQQLRETLETAIGSSCP